MYVLCIVSNFIKFHCVKVLSLRPEFPTAACHVHFRLIIFKLFISYIPFLEEVVGCSGGNSVCFNLKVTWIFVPALPLKSGVTLTILKLQFTNQRSGDY